MTTALLPFKSIIILSYLNFLQLKYFVQIAGQGSFPHFKFLEHNERSVFVVKSVINWIYLSSNIKRNPIFIKDVSRSLEIFYVLKIIHARETQTIVPQESYLGYQRT
ncbi:hypothetical protein DPV73_10705 [Leptospira mayottensis]|nr:hypothetical protein DPV73_10705 [Leptospira mayottensis]